MGAVRAPFSGRTPHVGASGAIKQVPFGDLFPKLRATPPWKSWEAQSLPCLLYQDGLLVQARDTSGPPPGVWHR